MRPVNMAQTLSASANIARFTHGFGSRRAARVTRAPLGPRPLPPCRSRAAAPPTRPPRPPHRGLSIGTTKALFGLGRNYQITSYAKNGGRCRVTALRPRTTNSIHGASRSSWRVERRERPSRVSGPRSSNSTKRSVESVSWLGGLANASILLALCAPGKGRTSSAARGLAPGHWSGLGASRPLLSTWHSALCAGQPQRLP